MSDNIQLTLTHHTSGTDFTLDGRKWLLKTQEELEEIDLVLLPLS